jgi:membrane protein DedA with SNARE-associated domain
VSLSADALLTALLVYGYPVLFGVVLAGSIGLPVPSDLFVLAAGGFVASGDLDLVTVLVLVFAAAITGDCLVFLVVRWLGHEVVVRHGRRIGLGEERLAAARARFGAFLGLSVFVTRWLLTPLSVPATVLAALGRYPLGYFAAFAVAGELIWTGAFVALGYAFGESWSTLLEWVQDSLGLLAGLCLAGVGVALLVWLLRNRNVAAPVESGWLRRRTPQWLSGNPGTSPRTASRSTTRGRVAVGRRWS